MYHDQFQFDFLKVWFELEDQSFCFLLFWRCFEDLNRSIKIHSWSKFWFETLMLLQLPLSHFQKWFQRTLSRWTYERLRRERRDWVIDASSSKVLTFLSRVPECLDLPSLHPKRHCKDHCNSCNLYFPFYLESFDQALKSYTQCSLSSLLPRDFSRVQSKSLWQLIQTPFHLMLQI